MLPSDNIEPIQPVRFGDARFLPLWKFSVSRAIAVQPSLVLKRASTYLFLEDTSPRVDAEDRAWTIGVS